MNRESIKVDKVSQRGRWENMGERGNNIVFGHIFPLSHINPCIAQVKILVLVLFKNFFFLFLFLVLCLPISL